MVYTPNHDPWADSDTMTTTIMDNFETIWEEQDSYLTTHTHDDLYQTQAEVDPKYWGTTNTVSNTGSDADLITYGAAKLDASQIIAGAMDSRMVFLWYGTVEAIPAGWHLCDGTEGTVDLRDSFIIGADTSHAIGSTGGSNTFTPTGTITIADHVVTIAEMPGHTHTWLDHYNVAYADTYSSSSTYNTPPILTSSVTSSNTGGGEGHTHSAAEGTAMTGTEKSMIPHAKALCYIQKIA